MITTDHALVWRHKKYNNYQFTQDGRCFNIKTGKELNQYMNNRCIGYCIKGKFLSLTKLKLQLEKIETNPMLEQLKTLLNYN